MMKGERSVQTPFALSYPKTFRISMLASAAVSFAIVAPLLVEAFKSNLDSGAMSVFTSTLSY